MKKPFAGPRGAQAEGLCHEESNTYHLLWHGLQSVQGFFTNLSGAAQA